MWRDERHWKHHLPNSRYPRRGAGQGRTKNEEAQASSEPHTKSVIEELLIRAIRLEPVKGPSQETYDKRRRIDTEGTDLREMSQQLKQVQLTIVELYQDNRELRHQLAMKTLKASAPQGREGNMTWLKRQLREAQDTIIQLHET